MSVDGSGVTALADPTCAGVRVTLGGPGRFLPTTSRGNLPDHTPSASPPTLTGLRATNRYRCAMRNNASIYPLTLLLVACGGGDDGARGPSGKPGAAALVVDVAEPPGANCPQGGRRLETGLDTDGDGVLSQTEIADVSWVCNAEGRNALVEVEPEAAGANCAAGGFRVVSGLDANGDGALQPGEVSLSTYVCDGETGAGTMLVLQAEPAGANCAAGGVRIDAGIDADRDGTLDSEEATTRWICNGQDGRDSLIRHVTIARGDPECPLGGIRFLSGLDLNRNGVLEEEEVTAESAICDSCRSPRFVRAPASACPVDDGPLASGFFTNGVFLAVSTGGDAFLLSASGGGGDTTMIRVANDGSVTSPFWTSSFGEGTHLGDVAASGDQLYLAQFIAGGSNRNLIGWVGATDGIYRSVYDAPRNGWYAYDVAPMGAEIYFLAYDGSGVYAVNRITSETTFETIASPTGVYALHGDPIENRLYWVSGASIRYIDLDEGPTPPIHTLATLPGSASDITTDRAGRVYVNCSEPDGDFLSWHACPWGSLWRVRSDGSGLEALTDETLHILRLDYHGDDDTVYLIAADPGGGYAVERLRILDPLR